MRHFKAAPGDVVRIVGIIACIDAQPADVRITGIQRNIRVSRNIVQRVHDINTAFRNAFCIINGNVMPIVFYSQNNMLILPHIAHYLFLHCGGGRITRVILHTFKFKSVYHLCGLVPIQVAVVTQAAVGVQPVNKRCNVERVGCSVSALNNYLCYGCYKAADLRHRFSACTHRELPPARIALRPFAVILRILFGNGFGVKGRFVSKLVGDIGQ